MIENFSIDVKWLPGMENKVLHEIPDRIIYSVARQTLDLTYPTIPELTGKLKQSSLARGVQGGNGVYKIGSYTDYASYVYVKNNEKTNWTTPGTNSHWFTETLQKKGKSILQEAVRKEFKE